MVAGALGVAVVGSLVSSLYSNDVDGSFRALPPQAEAAAEDSIGAAEQVAAQLPTDAASRLIATAGDSFTDAMGTGLLAAAALALGAALAALRFLQGITAVSGEPKSGARQLRDLDEAA
jgi:hypothetical protein